MAESASQILQNELTRLNNKKTNIDQTMTAQGRLMTLNESYRKKYSRYTQILGIFVFAVIFFLIVNALPKVAPFIPKIVTDILNIIVIVGALYMILKIYMEINSRSNVNYDELDLAPTVDASMNSMSIEIGQELETEFDMAAFYEYLAKQGVNTCFGAQCCPDGYKYDKTQNKCISASGGFTQIHEVSSSESGVSIGKKQFPSDVWGSPPPLGQSFSTVGEGYVEDRFKVRPLE